MAERFTSVREHFAAISGSDVSQRAMAERLGVAKNTWQRYEAGDMPSATVLVSLAAEGINSHWLLTGEGEMFVPAERSPAFQKSGFGLSRADQAGFEHLSKISSDARHPENERASADVMLDLVYGNQPAAERREQRMQATFADLRAATSIYSEILKELDWLPPPLVGMAIRDAMFTDGLSREAAGFILAAIKNDLGDKGEK